MSSTGRAETAIPACPVPDGNASLSVRVTNGPGLIWAGNGYTTEQAQRALVWFALTQLSGPLSITPAARELLDVMGIR